MQPCWKVEALSQAAWPVTLSGLRGQGKSLTQQVQSTEPLLNPHPTHSHPLTCQSQFL